MEWHIPFLVSHERLGIAARCCGPRKIIFEATKFAKDREARGIK
ncbi:MAG: hypothetical protein CM1200mP13_12980 [Candidatus Pelagibacterales bacterium]|nr:MAG: hypothetical protein CM1200mP13_12980 [Pelagibacterales bacterium]